MKKGNLYRFGKRWRQRIIWENFFNSSFGNGGDIGELNPGDIFLCLEDIRYQTVNNEHQFKYTKILFKNIIGYVNFYLEENPEMVK